LGVKTKNKPNRATTQDTGRLFELFKRHLNWNKARLKCFALFVLAVLEERTVSLSALSLAGCSTVRSESLFRRFQRFLAGHDFEIAEVGSLVVGLLARPKQGWVLAMDRTNWKFGRKHVNILVLSVVVGKMAFPVLWKVLPASTKRGNSKQIHRVSLMKKLLGEIMAAREIRALVMDREFNGQRWLAWLEKRGVPYVLRVKRNTWIGERKALDLCLRNRWKRWRDHRFAVFGRDLYFAAKKIGKRRDSRLAVVSNKFRGGEALEIYRLRWGIECFFGHLKKRGFRFEDTHLTIGKRIERLVAVLAVAFTLCYRWGMVREARSGKKIKNHGYRAKSLFRQGFDSLHRMVKRPVEFAEELKEFVWKVLSSMLAGNFVV